jgi:hypothetical protein
VRQFIKPSLRPLRCLLERPLYLFLHDPEPERWEAITRAGYRLVRVTPAVMDGRSTYIWKLLG